MTQLISPDNQHHECLQSELIISLSDMGFTVRNLEDELQPVKQSLSNNFEHWALEIRSQPDLIVSGFNREFYIDCKTITPTNKDTGNVSIEATSFRTNKNRNVLYVFRDDFTNWTGSFWSKESPQIPLIFLPSHCPSERKPFLYRYLENFAPIKEINIRSKKSLDPYVLISKEVISVDYRTRIKLLVDSEDFLGGIGVS